MASAVSPYFGVLPKAFSSAITLASSANMDLTTSDDKVAAPLFVSETATISSHTLRVLAGTAADDVRCRIVERDAGNNGHPDLTTLVHANADLTINTNTGAAEDLVFNFTDFEITPGEYWVVYTADSSGAFDVNIAGVADDSAPGQIPYDNQRGEYWDGSDWDQATTYQSFAGYFATTTGYLNARPTYYPIFSSTANVYMDSLQNPDSVGNVFKVAQAIDCIGVQVVPALFSANTSVRIILASSDMQTALAEAELFEQTCNTAAGIHSLSFTDGASLLADTEYTLYVVHGVAATTTAGFGVGKLDVSASADLIQALGVPSGSLKSVSAHDPGANGLGGSGARSTDADYIYPFVPVFDFQTLSSGGGGGGSAAFNPVGNSFIRSI